MNQYERKFLELMAARLDALIAHDQLSLNAIDEQIQFLNRRSLTQQLWPGCRVALGGWSVTDGN